MSAVRKHIMQIFQVLVANLPREDYPPANIAAMIKQCEAANRKDLADQIRMQWVKVINKYPETRMNWAVAVKIGGNSIKKNIFQGKEFVAWFAEQQTLTPEEKKAAQEVVSIMPTPKGIPAIAIPKNDETPEDWKIAAGETRALLVEAKRGFKDAKAFIAYLEQEITGLQKKIADYGPEGSKGKTKEGKPSKYASRVPTWQGKLDAYLGELQAIKNEVKSAESNFKEAENKYNHAPITTVAYEKKTQINVTNILEYITNMDDLEKQKEAAQKFNELLGKLKEGQSTAQVEVTADLFGTILNKLQKGWAKIVAWVKGLKNSINSFNKLASLRYEVEM